MELIDKKQVEAFKRLGRRLGGDPGRLRMTVCVLLAGIGILGVERPLGMRLARARSSYVEAKKTSQMAEEVAFYTRERQAYEPRAEVSTDITDWQNYVLERLRCTTATLISLEPHKPLPKGVFTVLEMEVVAKGTSYLEFADFVDRLERGERLVRVEKLRLEKQQTSIYMTCLIRGLVKNAAKPSGKSAAAASAKGGAAGAQPSLDVNNFVGPLLPGTAAGTASAAESAAATETETEAEAEAEASPAAVPDAVSEPEPNADPNAESNAPEPTPDETPEETHDA